MAQEFDQYSKNYKTLLDETLKSTGFDADFFVAAKLKKLARLFPGLCDKPIQFLDFGCGNGALYKNLAQFFPQAQYTGTDLSDDMVKEARCLCEAADVFFEIESEAWKQKTYDLIFIANVFHHTAKTAHKKILRELRSLLKKNGTLILWEHNPINPFTRKIVRDCIFDKDAELIAPAEMKRLFRAAGFSRVKIIFTTFFPKSLSFLISLENHLERCPLGGQYITLGENPQPQETS